MKTRPALIALYAAFITYSLLTLFLGQSGVAALERIHSRHRLLSANMADLDEKHRRLKAHLSGLMTDPEAVAAGARSLGLVSKGEYIVILDSSRYCCDEKDAGEVLQLQDIQKADSGILGVVSLTAGAVVFLIMLAAGKERNAYSKRR